MGKRRGPYKKRKTELNCEDYEFKGETIDACLHLQLQGDFADQGDIQGDVQNQQRIENDGIEACELEQECANISRNEAHPQVDNHNFS